MMMVTCAGCDRPILDRFLFNVLDRTWHAKCVQCSECGSSLTEKCFSRDGKLYCRDDFFRRYGTKCAGCLQGISPNDLVRRARNKVFHLKCFTCLVCRKQLSTGEELYILDENKFICKDDYLNGKYEVTSDGEENEHEANPDDSIDIKLEQSLSDKEDTMESSDPVLHLSDPKDESGQSLDSPLSNSTPIGGTENGTHMDIGEPPSPLGDDDIGTESVKSEKEYDGKNNNNNDGSGKDEADVKGGAKKRGPRTTIKAKQLETLKAAFAATPKPTRHIREQLAKETGLNMRVIQVWFQNRRSKERRMKQLSALGARRHFFRNPRRMRIDGLSPADIEDNPELLGQQGFYPFPDGGQGDLLPGYQGYGDFFPGPPGEPGAMGFPGPGGPPGGMLDPQGPPPNSMGQNGQFLPPNDYPPTSSDHHIPSLQSSQEGAPGMFSAGGPPPSSMASQFNPSMGHQPPREMATETW